MDSVHRAADVKELLDAVQPLLLKFIARADEADHLAASSSKSDRQAVNGKPKQNLLIDDIGPVALHEKLLPVSNSEDELPRLPQGQAGLLQLIEQVLAYSTNTWHQGFLDKLYHSTTPTGVAAELLLAVLNTNVHVYKVSPALTVLERATARALARLFGLAGPRPGGIVQPGGSASNLTALVVARNTLFPATKTAGNAAVPGRGFAVFTSAHAHYSLEKACQVCGMGAAAVRSVPVDRVSGRMSPAALEAAVVAAMAEGYTPLMVSGTAGTTVLGSFDPLDAIADVCARHGLWFHVDGAWGGAVAFSDALKDKKLAGVHRADSVAFNAHKMLGAPIQCSFLLLRDLRTAWRSNTLPASYLFHGGAGVEDEDGNEAELNGTEGKREEEDEVWDLADLTLQCGRRGDALKLALSWVYHGREGIGKQVDAAFEIAAYFASLVVQEGELKLVGENPPPCLQVCFYYAGASSGEDASGEDASRKGEGKKEAISRWTQTIAQKLQDEEFLVDYASVGDDPLFLRVVVGLETTKETVERLVRTVVRLGREVSSSSLSH